MTVSPSHLDLTCTMPLGKQSVLSHPRGSRHINDIFCFASYTSPFHLEAEPQVRRHMEEFAHSLDQILSLPVIYINVTINKCLFLEATWILGLFLTALKTD